MDWVKRRRFSKLWLAGRRASGLFVCLSRREGQLRRVAFSGHGDAGSSSSLELQVHNSGFKVLPFSRKKKCLPAGGFDHCVSFICFLAICETEQRSGGCPI